jgi:hypothetical protein
VNPWPSSTATFGAPPQRREAVLDLIGERVAHRDELHVGVGEQRVRRRPGAAPATPPA